jgi:hypothetical protein
MDEQQLINIIRHISSMEKEEASADNPGDMASFVEETPLNPKEIAVKLNDCYALFKVENQFAKGQLVKWKKGLKNRKYPRYEEPAVVLEVLDSPIYSGDPESVSPYFREPLDIVLGVIIQDDFEVFYYDRRRLTAYKETIA